MLQYFPMKEDDRLVKRLASYNTKANEPFGILRNNIYFEISRDTFSWRIINVLLLHHMYSLPRSLLFINEVRVPLLKNPELVFPLND